jgi:hypothetical protein
LEHDSGASAANGFKVHPDVEPFARDVAEKQKAFFEAHRRLDESMHRLRAADITALSYYQISSDHTRVFKEWADAKRALEKAVRELHRAALTAANVPQDHPLWKLAQDPR